MAGSHGRVLVVGFGRLAMSGERPQHGVETPAFERLLLRFHPGVACERVGRDRRRGGAQIFADMIEINQVAPLVVTGADFRAALAWGGPNEGCEIGDAGAGNGEAGAEIVEERDFELPAGLGEAEHDVAGDASVFADGSA